MGQYGSTAEKIVQRRVSFFVQWSEQVVHLNTRLVGGVASLIKKFFPVPVFPLSGLRNRQVEQRFPDLVPVSPKPTRPESPRGQDDPFRPKALFLILVSDAQEKAGIVLFPVGDPVGNKKSDTPGRQPAGEGLIQPEARNRKGHRGNFKHRPVQFRGQFLHDFVRSIHAQNRRQSDRLGVFQERTDFTNQFFQVPRKFHVPGHDIP